MVAQVRCNEFKNQALESIQEDLEQLNEKTVNSIYGDYKSEALKINQKCFGNSLIKIYTIIKLKTTMKMSAKKNLTSS